MEHNYVQTVERKEENKFDLKGVSSEKEGGSKVGSIESYYCGTVALEGKKIRAFAVVFYFILFRFRQEQHKTLQVRCGLCKCAAVWPLRTCLLHSSDFASVMRSTPQTLQVRCGQTLIYT